MDSNLHNAKHLQIPSICITERLNRSSYIDISVHMRDGRMYPSKSQIYAYKTRFQAGTQAPEE